jgi:hypothetical protein
MRLPNETARGLRIDQIPPKRGAHDRLALCESAARSLLSLAGMKHEGRRKASRLERGAAIVLAALAPACGDPASFATRDAGPDARDANSPSLDSSARDRDARTPSPDASDGAGRVDAAPDPFTELNPPPASWYPYPTATSLFKQRLPSDVMSHLFQPQNYGISGFTGDEIASCSLTACGTQPTTDTYLGFQSFDSVAADGAPGANDLQKPVYYATASDPWYEIKNCPEAPGVDVKFHAPNLAQYSNGGEPTGCTDQLIAIYDQSQEIFVSAYRCATYDSSGFPSCTATTPDEACLVPSPSDCSAERVGVDRDWGWGGDKTYTTTINGVTEVLGSAGDNLPYGAAGSDGLVRFEEFMHGIDHAFASGIYCTNSQNPMIFPATITAAICNSTMFGESSVGAQGAEYAPNGSLAFLDYTDAQISAMELPPFQLNLVTALAHYGTYVQVTGGEPGMGFSPGGGDVAESGMAYYQATGQQHPFFSWLNGQKVGSPSYPGGQETIDCGDFAPPDSQYRCNFGGLYGIPDVDGKDISGHIHIADPCLVKRMLGVGGAC